MLLTQKQKLILLAVIIFIVLLGIATVLFSAGYKKQVQKNPELQQDKTGDDSSYSDSNYNSNFVPRDPYKNVQIDTDPTISNSANSPTESPNLPSSLKFTDSNTLVYSNTDQQYGIRYLKSWKINNKSTVTFLVDPTDPNSQRCDIFLPGMVHCGVLISTIPFFDRSTIGPEVTFTVIPTAAPRDQQVKDSANALFGGYEILPTTINDFSGYSAMTVIEGTNVFNVMLQGEKNMILLQFPGKWSRSTLSAGQRIVLESIVEL